MSGDNIPRSLSPTALKITTKESALKEQIASKLPAEFKVHEDFQ
jgi:hypothetical protein